MTEQQKRKKALEEMARYIGNCDYIKFRSCKNCEENCRKFCTQLHLEKQLYDAGYRKEEEVRREVFDKLIEVSKNFEGVLPAGVLKALAIEFGVEVEE